MELKTKLMLSLIVCLIAGVVALVYIPRNDAPYMAPESEEDLTSAQPVPLRPQATPPSDGRTNRLMSRPAPRASETREGRVAMNRPDPRDAQIRRRLEPSGSGALNFGAVAEPETRYNLYSMSAAAETNYGRAVRYISPGEATQRSLRDWVRRQEEEKRRAEAAARQAGRE